MKNTVPVKIACIVFGLLSTLSISAVSDVAPPGADITNGLIRAHLYFPDAEKGYYRATRFDWSGVVSSLEFNGHPFYSQWYEKYDPLINDAIMGPVEAFDPLGYDEAKPGEGFVKIGIGLLSKLNNNPYDFATYYPIINAGKWKVKAKEDQVKFTHSLKGTDYAYEYTKTVKLIKNKPVMELDHTLKNTGKKAIITEVFNHNFLVIDKQITGPGFEITFPVVAEKVKPKMQDLMELKGNKLIFLKELTKRNAYFNDLTGGNGAEYDIKVENHNTGAAVRIKADRRISKLVFWSASKTICPEPYIDIKIEPGQVFTWKITNEYSVNAVTGSSGNKR